MCPAKEQLSTEGAVAPFDPSFSSRSVHLGSQEALMGILRVVVTPAAVLSSITLHFLTSRVFLM